MKIVRIWIFLGVMIEGVIGGHASLRAQPAGESVPTIEPPQTDGEIAPTGEPSKAGSKVVPPTVTTVSTDDPDKPWNQGVSQEDRVAARELFLEGNRRFRIPLFAKAAERYKAALEKWKHPAFYFNLAIAQLNLGQDVEARESLILALKYGEEPLGGAQFQEARKQLQEVTRQLGRIRVICSTEGAEVALDGVKLFTGPGRYEGWAKAKSHEITATKAGYYPAQKRVIVSSGQLQETDLKVVTLRQAVDASRRWAVWKPWAVLVAGGAIAAASAIPHRLASTNFREFDSQVRGLGCTMTGPPGCTEADLGPELNEQLKLATRERSIALGGYIVGGSLFAAGAILLYLNQPRLKEPDPAHAPFRAMTVAPALSPDMVGLVVSLNR